MARSEATLQICTVCCRPTCLSCSGPMRTDRQPSTLIHKRRVLGNHQQLQSADDNSSERPRHIGPELLRANRQTTRRENCRTSSSSRRILLPERESRQLRQQTIPSPAGTAQGSTTEHSAAPGARGVIPSTTPSDLGLDASLAEELQGSTLRKDQNTQRHVVRLSSPGQYTLRFIA